MKTVVEHIDRFRYVKFQPGDGTLYTAMYGQADGENLYIALGSGDGILGGYFFRIESAREMLVELKKWIDTGKTSLEFVQQYHWISYIRSHMRSDNPHEWTVIVMCLFAAIVAYADPSNGEAYGLIPAVYCNQDSLVLEWLEEWGIVV